jgi:RHS repeat-associated protein
MLYEFVEAGHPNVTPKFGYNERNGAVSKSHRRARGSIAYTPNNLNQYGKVGSVTPTYDGNGDLTYDGSDTYCYDAESRLAGILSSGTCASPVTTVASYAYDAQGRRKSKTVGSTTTIYVTDTDNREVLEYNGSTGALGTWYSFAPAAAFGPDAVLNQMTLSAGTRQTLIPDVQGSIAATLDSGTGALTKIGYQTFGEHPTLAAGSYRYTARRYDAETAVGTSQQPSGLYYYRARMYSPTWGRFLQPDPIGYQAGTNLYMYAGNDPLDLTDPGGQCYPWCTVIAGVLIAEIGAYTSDPAHFTYATAGAAAVTGAAVGLVPLLAGFDTAAGGAGALAVNLVTAYSSATGGTVAGQIANGQPINVPQALAIGGAAVVAPLVSGEAFFGSLGTATTGLTTAQTAYVTTFISTSSMVISSSFNNYINQLFSSNTDVTSSFTSNTLGLAGPNSLQSVFSNPPNNGSNNNNLGIGASSGGK